jgi:choline dehydrogenase-like flavoprotein
MSTERTFLRDAAAHDADVLVRCRAKRILVEAGRATGVEAEWMDPGSDRRARVVVRAPRVVVACGALESPALLRRSGIGGPAVGAHLRLHPCTAVMGTYGEDQQAWWGAPHAVLVDEFADVRDGHGFLIEGAQYTTGVGGSAVPWTGGEVHKELLSRFRSGVSWIALTRDRGHGRVDVDADGEALPTYAVTDELDAANLRLGIESIARLHEAAGAQDISVLAAGLPRWRRGDDLEGFITRARRTPLRAGGARLFSAHQMGSCRMGTDPATSVADPWGRLHDTRGVWIGDGSAFPTASGTNPMVSIMALAHRTAEAIAGVRDEAAVGAARD